MGGEILRIAFCRSICAIDECPEGERAQELKNLSSLMAPCASDPKGQASRMKVVFALADLQDCLPQEVIEPSAPGIAAVLLGGDSEATRALAAFVLGRLGEIARPFCPLLTNLLSDPSVRVRLSAIGALGNMGEAAYSASSRLEDLATAAC